MEIENRPISAKVSGLNKQVETTETQKITDTSVLDRWQQGFDASPDLIAILDKDRRILAINDAMAKTIDCRPEQAKGQRCCKLFNHEASPPVVCPHRCLIEDGKPHQEEIYDEKLKTWFLIRATPLHDDAGHLIGSIHNARDISHLKHIEQELRESQERYRHLSEATMEGVLLSQQSSILATNHVLADMVGYSVEDLKGKNLLKFAAPHDRKRLAKAIRGGLSGHYEFTCVKKDGTQFPVEARTRKVAYQGKSLFQTAIRDLTLEKHIQQERDDRERLQGVLEMAGTVCHELNQPLTAIYGYLDLLRAQLPANRKHSAKVEQVVEQIQRIETITQKLTHITRYKTKRYAGGEKIIDLDQATSARTPDQDPT